MPACLRHQVLGKIQGMSCEWNEVLSLKLELGVWPLRSTASLLLFSCEFSKQASRWLKIFSIGSLGLYGSLEEPACCVRPWISCDVRTSQLPWMMIKPVWLQAGLRVVKSLCWTICIVWYWEKFRCLEGDWTLCWAKCNLDQWLSTCGLQTLRIHRLRFLLTKATKKSNQSSVDCSTHPAVLTFLVQEPTTWKRLNTLDSICKRIKGTRHRLAFI